MNTVAGTPDRVDGPSTGVIHDIGYRHYDGDRRGRGYIRRSLLTDSLRGAYGLGRSARSKVLPMLLLGAMCLPAGAIVAITAVVQAPELVARYPSYLLNVQILISMFLASQAPVMVSRDLRYGVMPLYLSRPLERSDYVVAKWGAMAGAMLLFTAAPIVIMFVGALVVGLPLGEQLPDVLRALAGAVTLSVLLAGVGLVIAAITPRRGLAVAAIIGVLLVLGGMSAILQEIAIETGSEEVGAWLSLLSPYTLVQVLQSALFGGRSLVPVPRGAAAAVASVAVTLAVVAACAAALFVRYRKVSAS